MQGPHSGVCRYKVGGFFIYLKGKVTQEKVREREIFHLLVYSQMSMTGRRAGPGRSQELRTPI